MLSEKLDHKEIKEFVNVLSNDFSSKPKKVEQLVKYALNKDLFKITSNNNDIETQIFDVVVEANKNLDLIFSLLEEAKDMSNSNELNEFYDKILKIKGVSSKNIITTQTISSRKDNSTIKKEFEYDIFLSFSSKNEKDAINILKKLKNIGLKIFISNEVFKKDIGSSFIDLIEYGLKNSKHFLLLATPISMKSKYVRFELDAFFNAYSGEERKIIILEGENFKLNIIPKFYQTLQFAKNIEEIIVFLNKENEKNTKNATKKEIKEKVSEKYSEKLNNVLENHIKKLEYLKTCVIKLKNSTDKGDLIEEIEYEIYNVRIFTQMNLSLLKNYNAAKEQYKESKKTLNSLFKDYKRISHVWVCFFLKDQYLKGQVQRDKPNIDKKCSHEKCRLIFYFILAAIGIIFLLSISVTVKVNITINNDLNSLKENIFSDNVVTIEEYNEYNERIEKIEENRLYKHIFNKDKKLRKFEDDYIIHLKSNLPEDDSLRNLIILDNLEVLKEIYPERENIINRYEKILKEKMRDGTFPLQTFQNYNFEFFSKLPNRDTPIADLLNLLNKMED